jgi:hypothetical protein
MSAANSGPDLFHHSRTVSFHIGGPLLRADPGPPFRADRQWSEPCSIWQDAAIAMIDQTAPSSTFSNSRFLGTRTEYGVGGRKPLKAHCECVLGQLRDLSQSLLVKECNLSMLSQKHAFDVQRAKGPVDVDRGQSGHVTNFLLVERHRDRHIYGRVDQTKPVPDLHQHGRHSAFR